VTAQDVYAALMKDTLAPALRALGLRGSGGRFSLPSDTHWALLGFQRSVWDDRDEIQLTVNLTVLGRAAWASEVAGNPWQAARPNPNHEYGTLASQTRLGLLLPGGTDTWWTVRADEPTDTVTDDVLAAIRDVGIPWLRTQIVSGPQAYRHGSPP